MPSVFQVLLVLGAVGAKGHFSDMAWLPSTLREVRLAGAHSAAIGRGKVQHAGANDESHTSAKCLKDCYLMDTSLIQH